MPQSLAKVYVHLIFSTKNRRLLIDARWQADLWAYMAGILQGQGSHVVKIGGVADHIHALFELSRTRSISKTVGELKSESTKWRKGTQHNSDFAWQNGYGAFSISRSHRESAVDYIANQEEHHKTMSFQDEFRAFLSKYEIPYDEQYIWD